MYPLYKKRSVYDPDNYRGIHLSAQLSKVVEKLLGRFFLPFLEATGAYGENQWAYRKLRGCKDAGLTITEASVIISASGTASGLGASCSGVLQRGLPVDPGGSSEELPPKA